MSTDVIYSGKYLHKLAEGSARSAEVVVPLLLSLLPAKSVIDVGCALGCWAAEFLARGVHDVWGVDGDYVPRSRLLIPGERFLVRDLAEPVILDRTFDPACCLEVAEHLPESRAAGLVADLVRMAPCVLFSAAVPGQEGYHHVNLQYLPYWTALFQKQGYAGIDPIRPHILGNDSVQWWYQQNTVMFVAPDHCLLARDFLKPQSIIHQELYDMLLRKMSLPMIARALPGALRRSIRFRLGLH